MRRDGWQWNGKAWLYIPSIEHRPLIAYYGTRGDREVWRVGSHYSTRKSALEWVLRALALDVGSHECDGVQADSWLDETSYGCELHETEVRAAEAIDLFFPIGPHCLHDSVHYMEATPRDYIDWAQGLKLNLLYVQYMAVVNGDIYLTGVVENHYVSGGMHLWGGKAYAAFLREMALFRGEHTVLAQFVTLRWKAR